MPWGVAAAAVVGAVASTTAANKQEKAAGRATALSRDQYNKGLETTAPFRELGINALPQLNQMAGTNVVPFKFRDAGTYLNDYFKGPEYSALNAQATDNILRNRAMTGGFRSGGTQADLAQIAPTLGIQSLQRINGQDLQEYGTNQAANADQFQRLYGLANLGANVATGNANAGANFASQAGQNAIAAGNAAAQGAQGVGQAIQGGISDYMGLKLYNQNRVNTQQPTMDYNQRLV